MENFVQKMKRVEALVLALTLVLTWFAMPSGTNAKTPEEPEHYFGYISPSEKYQGLSFEERAARMGAVPFTYDKAANFPSSFDFRTINGGVGVTPVKDQNPYGSCWTFAACASLESNAGLIGIENLDLSERQLGWTATHVPTSLSADFDQHIVGEGYSGDTVEVQGVYKRWYDAGGNDEMAIASLIKGFAPAFEEDYPYDYEDQDLDDSVFGDLAEYNGCKLRAGKIFSVNCTDVDSVKYLIQNYGALSIGMWASYLEYYSSNDYYNHITHAAYIPLSTAGFTTGGRSNHAVTVVGWDDNYSKSNFSTEPEGDGAWIVKNSWSTAFGDEGYFYLSYYDEAVQGNGQDWFAYTVNISDRTCSHGELGYNYDFQYQYDGGLQYFSYSDVKSVIIKFTATKNQKIIGVKYCPLASQFGDTTVELYRGVTSVNDLTDGNRFWGLGWCPDNTYAGYQHFYWGDNKDTFISEGETIFVKVTFENPVKYAVAKALDWGDGSSIIENPQANETYLTVNGSTFDTSLSNATACIKVMAVDYTPPVTQPTVTSADDVTINLANGASLAQIESALNASHTVKVKFSDNAERNYTVLPGYGSNSTLCSSLYAQFIDKYPSYNPSNKSAQTYTITGLADLSDYNCSSEYPINVTVNIAEGLTVKTVNGIGISLPVGTTLDDFITKINESKTTMVKLSNNHRVNKTVLHEGYASFYDLFLAAYPGGFNSDSEVTYTIYGTVDLSDYGITEETRVPITISVKSGGGGGGGGGRSVSSVEPIKLSFENGVPLEVIRNALIKSYSVGVKFNDGVKATVNVIPGYDKSGKAYESFYAQFIDKYGAEAYDRYERHEQKFTLTGYIDLSSYGCSNKYSVSVTLTVEEGKLVKTVGEISIDIANGVTLQQFEALLNKPQMVTITYKDNSTEEVEVFPGFIPGEKAQYGSFFEQFKDVYGENGYDPDNYDAQKFEIKGFVDLSKYGGKEKNYIKITINVKKAELCKVTFNGNGGEYLGQETVEARVGAPYEFKYNAFEYRKEDYIFAGWFTEPEGGDRVWAGTTCNGDITLYAHWLKVFTGKSWDVTLTSTAKGNLVFKWSQIKTKVAGYEISVSTDKKSWKSYFGPMLREKTFNKLKSGKTYYVRVRGYRFDSTGKKIYGAWSKVASTKVK
ncbi:MAG: InlB B-repeat-containing protein [Lachnospiraceae bacterium]|nr:InlB B-repeat-containing protein [Lachnospiraceae bacterium]